MVATATEAVSALDQALANWSQTQRGLWTQAAAKLSAVSGEIAAERGRRAARVSALQAMLAAASDERAAATIRAELEEARRLLQRADNAQAQAFAAEQEFGAARSRAGYALDPAIARARADLSRRLESLEEYRSSAPGAGMSVLGAVAVSAVRKESVLNSVLASLGVESVDLSQVDFSDNPIVGDKFGEGGADLPDYRWAAETWENVIRPGLADSLTRDDFEARDTERAAAPFRHTAIVFDLFLGEEAITLERRPNGTYNVLRGRHRIEAARQLGIESLPAKVLP
ncbi:hypothetical protein [Actinoplanes sp. NPDC051411]|uniref:hypothetical protein n=1 Tax=Actinoplanes sp. NPDC051411 TaxID=3155522 RepID=UPI00341E8DB8